MTDDELNKWLLVNVIGEGCGHTSAVSIKDGMQCLDECGKTFSDDEWDAMGEKQDYCQSLDAVRNVEEKVILDKGSGEYTVALMDVIECVDDMPNGDSNIDLLLIGMANARQRAESCKIAWESQEAK